MLKACYTMETLSKAFTVIIELRIEIDNDNIYIRTRMPADRAAQASPRMEEAEGFLFDGPDALTIKEAVGLLKSSRGTVDNLRKEGKLTSYHKGRRVRLDRREVEEARKWWSVIKGKV